MPILTAKWEKILLSLWVSGGEWALERLMIGGCLKGIVHHKMKITLVLYQCRMSFFLLRATRNWNKNVPFVLIHIICNQHQAFKNMQRKYMDIVFLLNVVFLLILISHNFCALSKQD